MRKSSTTERSGKVSQPLCWGGLFNTGVDDSILRNANEQQFSHVNSTLDIHSTSVEMCLYKPMKLMLDLGAGFNIVERKIIENSNQIVMYFI